MSRLEHADKIFIASWYNANNWKCKYVKTV